MKSNRVKQIVLVILLLLSVSLIVFLTTQSSEDTSRLTESLRSRLSLLGLDISFHQLRSFVHLPEFFVIGFLLELLFISVKKKHVFAIITGFILSTADECLRIFVPRREFDFFDLMRDYAGVLLGVVLAYGVCRLIGKMKNRNISNNAETGVDADEKSNVGFRDKTRSNKNVSSGKRA